MSETKSFVGKFNSSKVGNLYLIQADNGYKPSWYYLDVHHLKRSIFDKIAQAGEEIDLNQWGRTVISGWGENPPRLVKEKIFEEGVNFDQSDEMIKSEIVFVQSVTTDGLQYYSFVCVPIYLLEEFESKVKEGNVNFNDYGNVVYSDWGWYPEENILEAMRVEYNMARSKIQHMLKTNVNQ